MTAATAGALPEEFAGLASYRFRPCFSPLSTAIRLENTLRQPLLLQNTRPTVRSLPTVLAAMAGQRHRCPVSGTVQVSGSTPAWSAKRMAAANTPFPQRSSVTVKLAWHFSKVNPRFKNREATQGEFFASDTELRGFVREAIQNSLDARRPDHNGPVSVRIFLSGTQSALPRETAKPYFRGGWDHFRSQSSGLRDVPDSQEPCCFLVYEDSGTTGLTGDTEQYHEIVGRRNAFYYFFRAEGQSHKLETGRGRWGLGKYVFPRSSRIRTFFALTVRCDDRRRLLVGQAILRSHQVDGKSYTPDGWFGGKLPKDEVVPAVEDREFIRGFERDFCLERRDEPGLSVVVPYCDATWSVAAVASCVVQDYFAAILNDELVVTVEGPESSLVLQSQSLTDVLTECDPQVQQQLQPLLALTMWSRRRRAADDLLRLPCTPPSGPPRWSRRDIPQQPLRQVQDEYAQTGRVAVRIPVNVQPRGHEVRESWLEIFLERSVIPQQRRPVFVRDGIVIAGVRSRLLRDVSALVHIQHPPLSAFLGDAENPAHTEWHEESSHFKGRYQHGPATLRFVRNVAADLCQLLHEDITADDSELLLDVFSIGTGSTENGRLVGFETRTSRGVPGQPWPRSGSGGRRGSRSFRVTRRKGGFRVAGVAARSAAGAAGHGMVLAGQPTEARQPTEAGQQIEIRVAYDRRQGHPLRQYSVEDFQLGQAPVRIESQGVRIALTGPNVLVLTPEDPAFEVVVTGFDENRDLYLATRSTALPVPLH